MRSLAKHRVLGASAAELLEARAIRYAALGDQERTVLFSVVTFRRAQGVYALPLTALTEIRALTRWCAMPGASQVVPGVVHCRGELLSLHDLARFSGRDEGQTQPEWVLVAEHRNRRLGVMADEVMDVVEIEAGAIRSIPVTLGDAAELFSGMTAEGVLVIDAPRMFDVPRFAKAF